MQKTKAEQRSETPAICPPAHFLACLVTMLRGGVTGRLPLGFFFSAGFKIYKKEYRGLEMLNKIASHCSDKPNEDAFLLNMKKYLSSTNSDYKKKGNVVPAVRDLLVFCLIMKHLGISSFSSFI